MGDHLKLLYIKLLNLYRISSLKAMDLACICGNVHASFVVEYMSFTLPGLLPWRFRIVLIGQHVVLEASSESQHLSTILEPTSSRIRRGYELVQSPQCALINDCPA